MARKGNLFGTSLMKKEKISNIIDRAMSFEFGDAVTKTRDLILYQSIMKSLQTVSTEIYHTKTCIDDSLLNDILGGHPDALKYVDEAVRKDSGYECLDVLKDKVYFLCWAAISDTPPEYKSLEEFKKSLSK